MAIDTTYITADAVAAILLEAKQVGVYKLTRTALTKYLYLLDYWTAKETNGKTFIGATWKFHHFGPYSDAIASGIDLAATQPRINKVDVATLDKDFVLYSLSNYGSQKTFQSIGVPLNAAISLTQAIKAFASDLNGLLNFVYFRTEPMSGVKPGDILDFSKLRKLDFKKDVQAIKIPVKNLEKAKRIKSLFAQIGSDWEESNLPFVDKNPPIRDLVFAETINDDLILEDGKEYIASLGFGEELK